MARRFKVKATTASRGDNTGDYIDYCRATEVNPGKRSKENPYWLKADYTGRYGSRSRSYRYYTGNGNWITSPTTYSFYDLGNSFGIDEVPAIAWTGPSHSNYSDLYQQCVSALFYKTKKLNETGFNAAIFLAEADKSVTMILSAARRIYLAQKALRRGKLGDMYTALGVSHRYMEPPAAPKGPRLGPKGELRWRKRPRPPKGKKWMPPPKQVSENASNYWLEAKYGWMPLLSDAYSAGKKVAMELTRENKEVLSVRHYVQAGQPFFSSPISDGPRTGHYWHYGKLGIGMCIRFRVSNEWIRLAASMGLTNPFLVAWETVPLSFVWDWFQPVANYFESLSTFHGLEFLSGWRTSRGTLYRGFSLSGSTTNPSGEGWIWNGATNNWGPLDYETVSAISGWHKLGGLERGILTEFPSASWPSVSARIGWPQAVTLTALIRQRL